MAPAGRPRAARADATDGLWRRLARPFVLTEVVDALMGLRPAVVEAFGAVKLCSSPEADALLAAMPGLSRSLSTSVSTQAVRSRGEVRGPVLWSETMSARASSFGDEDLFICSAPQREYDTPANRALRQALRTLAAAAGPMERAPEDWREDPRLDHARQIARAARTWAEHASLSRVSNDRVRPRDIERVRGGKSGVRYAPALALLDVAAEPLGPADLVALCDRRTRLQHWVLLSVLQELETRGLRLPPLRAEGGTLLSGPVTYVHPRHRRAQDLHGILVGHVLLDVAEPPDTAPPGATVEAELAARAAGRAMRIVRGYDDVREAVDLAVRAARDAVGATAPKNG